MNEGLGVLSNADLIARHAAPGLVGLVGGSALPDRSIRRAQAVLTSGRTRSPWSHAFLFEGTRVDGHHWVLESDLEIHRKQIRLGVQENRASKFYDAGLYPNIAILDFGLSDDQARRVVSEGLELLSGLARYSLRELVGTLLAIARPALRSRDNLLAREGALYCSAMVQHCYAAVGIEFVSGVTTKNVTPEDIASTSVRHTAHAIVRHESPRS